jgi:hypothetical protein
VPQAARGGVVSKSVAKLSVPMWNESMEVFVIAQDLSAAVLGGG